MAFISTFMERFRRVTSNGNYMPEIDGLRFIAIVLVAFFLHLGTYINSYVVHRSATSFLYGICWEGGYGVAIFFIISGFILSLPFARQYFLKEPQVELKKYFLRRLTRLEPAYILSLIIYFILRVWVMKYETFNELLPHFWASFFYLHTIVYGQHPVVNAVAWSLEIEVQFYLLAPLLCTIYRINNSIFRRSIFGILIICGVFIAFYQQYKIGTIFNNYCYFLSGMLMAELYLLNNKNFNSFLFTLLGSACLMVSLFIPSYYVSVWFCLLKLLLIFIFFFLVLHNGRLKKWLSYQPIAIIGGMCYSIYLIHQGVLGALRHHFAGIIFSDIYWLNGLIHYVFAVCIILMVSGVFFILVEKPTMKRDWYKKIFRFNKSLV